ncbi:MAG: alpha/beta hydrolase [Rhizobacter sp.]
MSTTSDHTARPRGPGRLLQALESRVLLELGAALASRPLWGLAPEGDGHSVLVLPGLAAGDESTRVLRAFLSSRNFDAQAWKQGRNLGLRPGVLDRTRKRLHEIARQSGRKVSLVGWSLGGVYARELAKEFPDITRQVITLGSPFTGHPRETNAWRLYEFVSGHRIGTEDIHEPLRTTPPVPTTSIWSRTDGVVSWRCSVERGHHEAENIVVESSHLGLGVNPAVLYAIADRLSQPEGHWKPFERHGALKHLFYRDPQRV